MTPGPESHSGQKKSAGDRVADVLDVLRPMLHSDGGDIELVDVDADGVVHVRLPGA